MLKLKLQYLGHLMRRTDSLEKTLMLGKSEGGRRREQKRMRWLDGITDSWTWVWVSSYSWWWTEKPGICSPWGHKEWDTTELLNWIELSWVPIFSSIQFSCWVVFDYLWSHELQHARPPCPSPTPRVHTNSCPSSPWYNPAISSSVVPVSSHLQSFPASESFQMSQLFTSGDRSIGVSASTSVLPMNIQDWFPLGWTGWISLQSKGLTRVFSNTTIQKHQFFGTQLSL